MSSLSRCDSTRPSPNLDLPGGFSVNMPEMRPVVVGKTMEYGELQACLVDTMFWILIPKLHTTLKTAEKITRKITWE